MNSGFRRYGMWVLTMLVLPGSACSTVYEGKYSRDAGWRPGTVLEVALGDHLSQVGQRDCRQYLPQASMTNNFFATVRFVNRSRFSTITVMLQNEIQIKPNDHVYINVADCNASVVPRTTP